jgi:hypothetical protein
MLPCLDGFLGGLRLLVDPVLVIQETLSLQD